MVGSTCAGLFLLAAATLMVEVLLTRIFDVILWPNLSFMIISSAMFGMGLGGLVETLRPSSARRRQDPSRTALLFSISIWALPLLLNVIPFAFTKIGRAPLAQGGWFLLLYLVLMLPFVLSGICICRLFSSAPGDIRRLYFWDLAGAALGTAVLIPLLPRLGPERLIIAAAVAGAAAAALFAPAKPSAMVTASLAAAFLVLPALPALHYRPLLLHENKREVRASIERGRLEFSRWDPVSEISVVDQAAPDRSLDRGKKHVAYDGGTQSSNFYPFDGNFAALRENLPARLPYEFWQRGVLSAHYLRRDTPYSALIIGSAGGQETKAALMYGAADIDAVEMVRTVVDLATGPYSPYIGRLFNRPQVHVHVAEGRSFVRASRRKYDVIQIFSNYTSSSAAAGTGALTPDSLQTVEAFGDYFSHLKPDGILQINHHTYPRIVSTAAAAWQAAGRPAFRSHVLVFERSTGPDYLPTLLIKMSPWTPSEVADAVRFFSFEAGDGRFAAVENPMAPSDSFLPAEFYSGELPDELLAESPFNVAPITDDRPYFNFLHRAPGRVRPDRGHGLNASTAAFLNGQIRQGWLPMDWLHLIVSSGAGLFYGVLFVVAPMLLSHTGRERWPGKRASLCYFSLLGLGFIAVQVVFIQIFMRLIGFPLYTVATVIAVMLIAAGIGSMTSRPVTGAGSERWCVSFCGVVAAGVAVWLVYEPLTSALSGYSIAVRIGASAAMIFPMAFFMGMPFPLGIVELRSKPHGAIAWAWSMNGLFATVGSVATIAASLWLGFRATVLLALAVYVCAGFAFAALRRSNRAAEDTAVAPSLCRRFAFNSSSMLALCDAEWTRTIGIIRGLRLFRGMD